MAAKSGKGGAAVFGTLAPLLGSWTLDTSQATLDVTGYAEAGARAVIAGVSQWSGTAEGFIDASVDVDLTGALMTVSLTDSDATVGSMVYTGNVILTSVSYSSSADGLCTISISFDGTGALTSTGT